MSKQAHSAARLDLLRAFRTVDEQLTTDALVSRLAFGEAQVRSMIGHLRKGGYLVSLPRVGVQVPYGLTSLGCRLRDEEQGATAKAVVAESIEQLRQRVFEALRGRSLSKPELAIELGANAHRVSLVIAYACRHGQVKYGERRYRPVVETYTLAPAGLAALKAAAPPAPPPPLAPPAPPPQVAGPPEIDRLAGQVEPDRPVATRPGARDYLQCYSRRGDTLVPMHQVCGRAR